MPTWEGACASPHLQRNRQTDVARQNLAQQLHTLGQRCWLDLTQGILWVPSTGNRVLCAHADRRACMSGISEWYLLQIALLSPGEGGGDGGFTAALVGRVVDGGPRSLSFAEAAAADAAAEALCLRS